MRDKTTSLNPLLLAAALALAVVVAPTAEAGAQQVRTNRSSPVYAEQGEQSEVVTRVRAGATVRVLSRSGRWVRVNANGKVGWIPRTYLEERQARSSEVQNKRKASFVEGRSRNQPARTGPKDRVGGEVVDEEFFDEFEEDKQEARPARASRERSSGSTRRKQTSQRRPSRDEDFEEFDDEDDWDEGPEEEVVIVTAPEAALYEDATARSDSVDFAEEGEKLYVLERDGDWILVENDRGKEGWVRSSEVRSTGGFRYEKWTTRAIGGVGYAQMGQSFTSSSMAPLGNYSIKSGSFVAGIGGDVIYDYSEDYLVAVDALFRYVRASPGIRYVDGNTAGDIPFDMYHIDVGARAGYKLSSTTGMAAYARVGYYYGKFAVDPDPMVNLALLPSEILQGVTVGAMLDVPRFNEKISMQGGVSVILKSLGTLTQTQGREDGNLSDSEAQFANARVDYQWKENLKLNAGYQFSRHKTQWTGAAMGSDRGHDAVDARRVDMTHTLLVGVGRLF